MEWNEQDGRLRRLNISAPSAHYKPPAHKGKSRNKNARRDRDEKYQLTRHRQNPEWSLPAGTLAELLELSLWRRYGPEDD